MIGLEIAGRVATLTLDRPPVNAIDEAWIERFGARLEEAEAADGVSLLRVRSAGAVFCAGADLRMVGRFLETAEGRDAMIRVTREIQILFERIERSPLVSLAEIDGAAMGGGLELALACDLRIAAEDARLGLPEARLGLLPAAGGTQRLSRVCGDAVARRLILGAEVVDGREALRLGLVHWAVPRDAFEERVRAVVERLAAVPGPAAAAGKACIAAFLDPAADGFRRELDESRRLLEREDARRRVRAFLERSEP